VNGTRGVWLMGRIALLSIILPCLMLGRAGIGRAQAPRVLTYGDNGSTITAMEGDGIELRLQAGMTWDVTVSDESVLAPDSGQLPPEDQGLWQAAAPGQSTIIANGRPVCNAGEVCAQLIVHFQATVVVMGVGPAAGPTDRFPGSWKSDAGHD